MDARRSEKKVTLRLVMLVRYVYAELNGLVDFLDQVGEIRVESENFWWEPSRAGLP